MKKRVLILLVVFLFIVLVGYFAIKLIGSIISADTAENIKANGATTSLTTQTDWDQGVKDANVNTVSSPGSVKLVGTESYNEDGVWSCDGDCSDLGNAHDRDPLGTFARIASGMIPPSLPTSITHTFATEKNITRIKLWLVRTFDPPVAAEYNVEYWDGDSWEVYLNNTIDPPQFTWDIQDIEVNLTTTAIRIRSSVDSNMVEVYEMEDYSPNVYASPGVLTTGATQIDGGENFWEWEDFTPAQTTPANTSIAYRYRTSTDGATWTDWVADIGSVTSRSGDDKYRYLQVEASLSNTDGVSTPTIDSYSINYHTEVKPSAPTAQTAVVE